jgi:putative transposon-encoded protein
VVLRHSACLKTLYGKYAASLDLLLKIRVLTIKNLEGKMTALKITSLGNSAGVLLPKELLAKLRVEKGDMLHVIETENGLEFTLYNPEFDA